MLQMNINYRERVPNSTLIKINVNVSPEFILEVKTTSAETDENMLSAKQTSCMTKFHAYAKKKKKYLEKLKTKLTRLLRQ